MHRPDRPLVVKCTFERSTKRITFSSARNCSYDLLRSKVEQCFPLFAIPYAIAYKDDDGEVADITTDSDLTEAIQYFQAGTDDPPLSSAASILSGRSFGSRRITLRVHIAVDYDGPSLSDTSSLASLEEYRDRNGSQTSFSFSSHHGVEMDDDDAVTVSSGNAPKTDTSSSFHFVDRPCPQDVRPLPIPPKPENASSSNSNSYQSSGETLFVKSTQSQEDPFSDETQLSASLRYPEDPSDVFDRLRLEAASPEDDFLSGDDRGAAWLRDQKDRSLRSMLGGLPAPSLSDEISMDQANDTQASRMGGDLALQRDRRGKYYYSYTSVASSSQTLDSGYDEGRVVGEEIDLELSGSNGPPSIRPTSMQLNWIASQQIPAEDDPEPKRSSSVIHSCSASSHDSDLQLNSRCYFSGIPSDVLQYLPVAPPPPDLLTECAECGVVLDAIRYVCTTCGQSTPWKDRRLIKGKAKNDDEIDLMSYPPSHRSISSSSHADSSLTLVNVPSSSHVLGTARSKPLPSLPSPSSSPPTLVTSDCHLSGYELCSGCIESAGVSHAIEAGLSTSSSPGRANSSPSSQDARSQWMRSAPRQKGQLRHGYLEKAWSHKGWVDVEQDNCDTCKCSTCNTDVLNNRYKCASCPNFNLCRACYSQVHLIHPSHAFLVVPDKPRRAHSESEVFPSRPVHSSEEPSMKHPDVKCAHCLLDIVGARFHCAVCESIEICSNCESAGLPGNLDSTDGGHNSSHIMIKIPYPVDFPEVQAASRRAVLLWTGRDAANVQRGTPRSRPSSIISSYAMTVVGFCPGRRHQQESSTLDHHILCNGCSQPIIGVRYQCASCPSTPASPYSLCAQCHLKSHTLHDAMHIFVKFPRPVQRPLHCPPLVPTLYRIPAGYLPNGVDPQEYLVHAFSICDRCMTRIQGEWFRCAYCSKDLCDACEELDTHDDTHVFLVFKSIVDMQLLRSFVDVDNPTPIIPYPVYY